MEYILVTTIICVAVLLAAFWWFQSRRALQQDLLLQQIQAALSRPKEADPTLMIMQQQLDALKEQMRQSLQESANIILQSQEQVGQRLGEVHRSQGQLEQATKHILEVGKDISSLQDILKPPKLRGGLGEVFLGNLLAQVLQPKHYALQHKFKSGEVVDAVIHFKDRLVAIDAKFPLENFRRILEAENEDTKKAAQKSFMADVRKHIDDISKKYILPNEGTLDLAFMYIPAENIYYETIIKDETVGEGKDLHTYAMEKKVIAVSPHSFYAYLKVIWEGFKGLEIEREAEVILQKLSQLQKELKKFQDDFDLMGKHLQNAVKTYDKSTNQLEKFDRLLDTTPGIPGTERQQLPLEKENN